MRRRLLTLRYDGTEYCGWQVQKNGRSVQAAVQDAVERVTGVRADITGCSRTDSGVHAAMYCCHFDTDSSLAPAAVPAALNAYLPAAIAVYDCIETPADFHARYSCKEKRYIYRWWNHLYRSPFYDNLTLHIRTVLDTDAMNHAAALFVGTHDFTSFCAAGGSAVNKVRTVSECRVERQDDMVLFVVTANGFLYNMVRIMAGTLSAVGQGKYRPEDIIGMLAARDRTAAAPTLAARGLMLDTVYYEL